MSVSTVFPTCAPARTHRGERPDKMRHPRSGRSADVMEGSLLATQSNDTTTAVIRNPNRRRQIATATRTVEWASGRPAQRIAPPARPMKFTGARSDV